MRLEGEDQRRHASGGGAGLQRAEDVLVTAVAAVEIADGDHGALERRRTWSSPASLMKAESAPALKVKAIWQESGWVARRLMVVAGMPLARVGRPTSPSVAMNAGDVGAAGLQQGGGWRRGRACRRRRSSAAWIEPVMKSRSSPAPAAR